MLLEDILGSGVTDNINLNKIGKYLFGNNIFLGVFSANEFQKHIKNNQCFIIPSNNEGEHFIAIYKKDGKIYGYDTFNRNVKRMSKFWKKIHIINANK